MNKKTSYALVTGASEGIGYKICEQLAARGYALILVARNEDRLHLAANNLTNRYGVSCIVITSDLSAPDAAETLYKAVQSKKLNVSILVNNAGLLFNGFFTELDWHKQQALLQCNIVSLTGLCHLFANDMVKEGSGKILNIASTAAWMAIPNQNVYAASKAYVLSFSQALSNELKAANSGITVTTLCPSYTATKMLNNHDQGKVMAIPTAFILTPEFVAQKGVDACLKGKEQSIPGISNAIGMALIQCLPKTWVANVFGYFYRRSQRHPI